MANTITNGIVTSFENTPQAGEDSFVLNGLSEDSTVVFYLNVMANDLGGNAKTLYSLDDGIENQGSATSPDLLTRDAVGLDNFSQYGALIEITADSKVAYRMTAESRAHFQYLGAGEVADDTFTYAIRLSSGAFSWAKVSVTLTGTNDRPIVAAVDVTGGVTELASPVGNLGDSGTIAFGDVDLSDVHGVGPVTASDGALGALSASVSTDTTGSGTGGAISWNYSVAASALEYLARDEIKQETFSFTLDDGNGGTVERTVNVTLTGTNDGPTVAAVDVTGGVTELASPVGNLGDSGTIAFGDVDLSDVHGVGPVTASDGALGALSASVSTDTTGSGTGGVISWNYSVAASALEYLAQDQIKQETFSFTLDDGNGGTVERTVNVTLTGTNDGPTVAAVDVTGGVTELASPVGNLGDSGTIAFGDVDLSDVHGVGPVTASDGALGALSASVSTDTTGSGTGGVISWNYSVAASALEYLAQDQVKQETFSFTLDDGNGGTVERTVSVTLTGTNDRPDIQLITPDSAAKILSETNSGLSISGALSVTDADAADNVSSSVTAVSLSGAAGGLASADVLSFLAVSPAEGLAANAGDAHNLTWSFNSGTQAFDYLNAGQSLTLDYTVQASDGKGGTDTQQVSITINGTADGPSDIVLTGVVPGAQNVPNGSIGQFTAVGASGSVSYGATLVEKTLAGLIQTDSTPDIVVSTSGLITAAGGSSIEDGRAYELTVMATDSGGSLTEMFRVVTGSINADTINLAAAVDDLVFLAGGNDTIFAGSGNDTVFGQNGIDLIHGGDGNDVLYGMNGADTFFFDTMLNPQSNVDTVMDFNANNNPSNGDTLYLSTAQFTGIGSGTGTLAAADFQQVSSGGSGNVSGLSVDGAVNVVYDSSTGSLYFDADGGSLVNATEFAVINVVGGTFNNGDIMLGL